MLTPLPNTVTDTCSLQFSWSLLYFSAKWNLFAIFVCFKSMSCFNFQNHTSGFVLVLAKSKQKLAKHNKKNCACLPKDQTETNGEPSATSSTTKANETPHGHSCRTSIPYKITLNTNSLLGQAFLALTSVFCCHFSMRVPLATKIIMCNLNGCLYAGQPGANCTPQQFKRVSRWRQVRLNAHNLCK